MRLDARQCTAVFKCNRAEIVAPLKHICRNARKAAVCGKGNACQVAATDERLLRNGGNTRRNTERRQPRIAERGVADARQCAACRKRDAAKRVVVRKGISSDLIHRIGDHKTRKRCILRECVILNIDERFWQSIGLYACTAVKAVCAHRLKPRGKYYRIEFSCSVERRISDRRDRILHGIRRYVSPCGIGNDLDRIYIVNHAVDVLINFVLTRHGNTSKFAAGRKSPHPKFYETCGQFYRCYSAVLECVIPDAHEVFGQRDLCETARIFERLVTDHL